MPPVESQRVRSPVGIDRPRKKRQFDFPALGDGKRWSPVTWFERLRRDIRSGGWGLVISCLFHAALAVAFALWIFQLPRRDNGDPLIMSWLRPGPAGGAPAARQPVRIPIDLGPGAVIDPSKPTDSPPSDDSGAGQMSGPEVKPVDVTQSLKPRRSSEPGTAVGGSDDAQQTIRRGLDWLKRMQLSDGRWEIHQGYPDAGSSTIKCDTGATGLAMLCFLGDGHTHQARSEFAETMSRGLKWLKAMQDPDTGDLHDMRYEEGRESAIFSHALATMVLCESLALTGDESLRDAAQRAVNYLIFAQHPQDGGWKYRPILKEANGDMAVTGWALLALHTARMAGIEVALEDLQRTSGFLDSVQEKYGARYKFEPLNTAQYVTPPLTAEGILCRQCLGWPRDYPPQIDAVGYLLSSDFRPQWTAGKRNVYSWFFIAQVLHNRGGDEWRNWYLPTRDLIVKHQEKNGKLRGSWHPTRPEGAREEYGEKAGRLYITAMCLLTLETPQRHAPIYADE